MSSGWGAIAAFPNMLSAVIVIVFITAVTFGQDQYECPLDSPNTPLVLYEDPDSCYYFFRCDHGSPRRDACSPGTVWSQFHDTCVGYNTHLDTCTRNNAVRECAKVRGSPLLIPHPTACQRYYNCANTGSPLPFLKPYEDECPYPQVFDINEKKCVSFKTGYCGPLRTPAKNPWRMRKFIHHNRSEVVDNSKLMDSGKSICAVFCGDYVKNLCAGPNCQECSSRLPSCLGLTDGIHEHPLKLWSPYYIVCDSQWLASLETCALHPETQVRALFSPTKQACVSQWEIPRDVGGLAPTCAERRPGLYQTAERQDVYYSCPSAEVYYCGVGARFNEDRGQCEK